MTFDEFVHYLPSCFYTRSMWCVEESNGELIATTNWGGNVLIRVTYTPADGIWTMDLEEWHGGIGRTLEEARAGLVRTINEKGSVSPPRIKEISNDVR